ncbi:MAG: low molecular weight phosphotyrosine protein phosphatase, partial [Gammaproteobacteria bacterium]|nr:low molecular weight phosphotyrosine protein phosphatase [Gammaproteobacteria bacterium]
CMGNICRSPTAEGVFRQLVNQSGLSDQIHIDSAGTHAYHIGQPPDHRAQAAALNRNIDLSSQRARKVHSGDFEQFDYVLAMDNDNYAELQYISDTSQQAKLSLFLDFATNPDTREVPDPYYGGELGFEHVLDLVEAAALGLLADIRDKHQL